MKRAGTTLVEMLVCGVIISATLGVCVMLTHTGVRWQESAEQMLDMHQHSRSLRDAWREAVGRAELSMWSVSQGELVSGNLRVAATNDALVVTAGEKELARTFVPRGLSCSMSVESSETGPCAVLSMSWVTRRHHVVETNRVRAVAMGVLK